MQIILKMSTCVAPPAPMNKKAGSLKALHRQDSETNICQAATVPAWQCKNA